MDNRSGVSSWATSLKKDGCIATNSAIAVSSMSAPSRKARHSSPGAAATKSSSVTRLYICRRSRQRTLSQWVAAIAVSSTNTRSAWLAGCSTPASSSMRATWSRYSARMSA